MLFLIQRLSHIVQIVQSDWRNTGLRQAGSDQCPAKGRAFDRGATHSASTPLLAWCKPHALTP
jgi:hypothetical protein